tara:strand:+ start:7238 stop:7666 length:429 start_codon:yes stop_codon:yes gene_type:complete
MVEIPPLPSLKTQCTFSSLYCIETCSVAVAYCIYDKRKKKVIDKGTSRACGENHPKISIHAEEKCISYCRKNDKNRRKYEIYIWRYSKKGKVKPVFSCYGCSKIISKFNYQNKVFTFENNKKISAMGQPYETIGNQLKHHSL